MKDFCIGIISYLPDDDEKRVYRANLLNSLLKDCDEKFKLDIIIIAQNWKNFKPVKLKNSDLILYKYNAKLGITNARIALRDKFLKDSSYDYIIMTDDDSRLIDNQTVIDEYLNTVNKTLKDFYWSKGFYIRFCCISRSGFDKVCFDSNVNAETGDGWEDVVFNKKCKKFLSCEELPSISAINRASYCNDKFSTWDCLNKDLQKKNQLSTQINSSKYSVGDRK